MSALKAFEDKYKFNPFTFVKEVTNKAIDYLKSVGLAKVIQDEAQDRYGVHANEQFYTMLVEAYQEAGERFPQNETISLDHNSQVSIAPINPSKPKTQGLLEDFKNIVGKDQLRPSTSGVYVDGSALVSTNAHILVRDVMPKNPYTDKWDKKIIDLPTYIKSKGDVLREIDDKFPNYEAVIPTDTPIRLMVDIYAMYNLARSAAFYLKLTGVSFFGLRIKAKDEIFTFNPVLLADLCEYMVRKGVGKAELRLSTPNRPAIFDFGASVALIMPIMGRDDMFGNKVIDIQKDLGRFEGDPKTAKAKPTAKSTSQKSAKTTVSQSSSSEPFKKYTGSIEDTHYVPRRDIDKIILKNGKELGTNDIVDGIYVVKDKLAYGGRIKSALARDRAYKSEQAHEKRYVRRSKPTNPRYDRN